MIRYVTGDPTAPLDDGRDAYIAHVGNDAGGWGEGFVLALSRRWREPERAFRVWSRSPNGGEYGPYTLGATQYVNVTARGDARQTFVATMIAQHRYSEPGKPAIRYNALERCLTLLEQRVRKTHGSVHMPRIGTGLGGGDWEIIEHLITSIVCRHGVPVMVYTLPEVQPG